MRLKSLIVVGSLAALSCMGAGAAPVTYEGTIYNGTSVTGSVGGFSYFFEDVSAGIDFWSFSTNAGSPISILGTRLNDNLDPAFSLYLGVTSADTSQFSAFGDWGGLTFLASADDEIPAAGPFGDPFLANFIAPVTGMYTIAIGGALSTDAGPYPYRLSLAVPEPGTMALVLVGVAAAGWGRRKMVAAT
jgi:hypothetical protein